jgi:hypothetical protein
MVFFNLSIHLKKEGEKVMKRIAYKMVGELGDTSHIS